VCGRKRAVRQSDPDAALHTYVAGKTGTGKSTLLLNLALERIREGHGLALIDPQRRRRL
jgi:type IV secretory pathway VirB4 component